MKLNTPLTNLALLCLVLSASFTAQASDRPQREHKGPPQEAFDACLDKVQGDSCEIVTPEQETLTGTCRTPPRESMLVCVPNNHKRRKKE